MPRAKTSDSKSAVQPRAASNTKIVDYYYPTSPKDGSATTNGSHCTEEASGGPWLSKVASSPDGGAAPLRTGTKAKKQRPLVLASTPPSEPAEKVPANGACGGELEAGDAPAGGRCEYVANGYRTAAVAVKSEPEASPSPAASAGTAAELPDTKHAAALSCAEPSAAEQPWMTVKGRKTKKSGRAKSSDTRGLPNRLVTDFFPVRRSDRTTAKQQKDAAAEALYQKIEAACEDGLKVVTFTGKGRGVVAAKPFKRGDFVVEYAGDLINQQEAQLREKDYTRDDRGCYMYYFNYKTKHYCVDATDESGRLGRLLNHSKQGNCTTKLVEVNGQPRLVIVAARDIEADEELLYDYGDRSKASLELHPWLKA